MASIWLAMAVSCNWSNVSYNVYTSVPQEWTRKDTMRFNLPELPFNHKCSFNVGIRYTDTYTYRDIWLLLRHNVEDSLSWQTDTIRCSLYDEEGIPLGKGMAGVYTVESPCFMLSSDGGHQPQVQIVHCMSNDSLRGISDVGLMVQCVPSLVQDKDKKL